VTTNVARLRGRAPKGERLRAAIPHGHWKTTTFIGALRLSGLTAPMRLDGPINSVWFQAYVDEVLAPTLTPGDVVIMDNLSSISAPACAPPSRPQAQRCFTFRPTAPTSTPSRTPSQSSKRFCARLPSEPWRDYGPLSLVSSPNSRRSNAQTCSPPLAMSRIKLNGL
jgi:hypothetical protein